MSKQEQNPSPITLGIAEEQFGFKVPGHVEIKFYYDTGADSLYEASRNLILACAENREKIRRLIDSKPAVVPQIAVNLLRIAGTGLEVKLENFPQAAADN
jgi:hypothetical protein